MNKNIMALTAVILAVVIIAGGFYIIGNVRGDDVKDAVPNDGLSTITEFDVSDRSKTESFANGTFFVLQEKNKIHIKMVAEIFVEEADKGGVEIYLPDGLVITEIVCSINGCISSDYVAIWETSDNSEKYHKFIQIARSLYIPDVSSGGAGTLIVEYDLDRSAIDENVSSLDFAIALGTKYSDTSVSTGIVHKTINVPLS